MARPRTREEIMRELLRGLDRHASHYAVFNLTAGTHVGQNVDTPVGLASSWKFVVAAMILDTRGHEFLNGSYTERGTRRVRDRRTGRMVTQEYERTFSNLEMLQQFLSMSDNTMGPRLALSAFGSEQAFYAALSAFRTRHGLNSFLSVHTDGIQSSLNPDGRLSFRDATTGYNSDTVGPVASPRDMARIMRLLYRGNGGSFDGQSGAVLRRLANPDSHDFGHTMDGYGFDHEGLTIIGCKSGTNRRARGVGGLRGDITASCVFTHDATGDVYVAFMHTSASGNRQDLVRRMLSLVSTQGTDILRTAGRLMQDADDLLTAVVAPIERAVERTISAVTGHSAPTTLLRVPVQLRREGGRIVEVGTGRVIVGGGTTDRQGPLSADERRQLYRAARFFIRTPANDPHAADWNTPGRGREAFFRLLERHHRLEPGTFTNANWQGTDAAARARRIITGRTEDEFARSGQTTLLSVAAPALT